MDEKIAIIQEAQKIYKVFYQNSDVFLLEHWKIEDWDVGWYQIRMALKEFPYDEETHFKAAVNKLSEKLLPQIYELGFLRDEVIYF